MWCTSDYRRQESGMEILYRLDALPQSHGDVLRLPAGTLQMHWYTLKHKSWEGEGKFLPFSFFDFPSGLHKIHTTVRLKDLKIPFKPQERKMEKKNHCCCRHISKLAISYKTLKHIIAEYSCSGFSVWVLIHPGHCWPGLEMKPWLIFRFVWSEVLFFLRQSSKVVQFLVICSAVLGLHMSFIDHLCHLWLLC